MATPALPFYLMGISGDAIADGGANIHNDQPLILEAKLLSTTPQKGIPLPLDLLSTVCFSVAARGARTIEALYSLLPVLTNIDRMVCPLP